MDRLHAMRVLVEIVDRGSLTRAAEAIGQSLPSVVRTLAALEEHLGVRLLNRTTRRIALTEEGRDYVERCRRILMDVGEAEAQASSKDPNPKGRLVLSAPVMFGRLHVAPVVFDFMARFRELEVELLLLDRVVNLLEEGIDATIRIGVLSDSSLIARPIGAVHRVICASPAFLREHGVPKKPSQLEGRPCVRFGGLGAAVELSGARTVLSTNQVDVALDACVRGVGYCVFLSYQVKRALEEKRLVRVLAKPEPEHIPVTLLHPQGRIVSSRLRAFIDFAVPRMQVELTRERSSSIRSVRRTIRSRS